MKPRSSNRLCSATAILIVATFTAPFASADSTWIGDTSQDWNDALNWTNDLAPTGKFTINTATGNFPIVGAVSSFTPNDVAVGEGATMGGRLDHRSGALTQGVIGTNGNWFFVGRNTGTGTYNLADTAATGGALTGFGTGTGSLTVGKLWVGGAPATGGVGTVNINTSGSVSAQSTSNPGGGAPPACGVIVGYEGGSGTVNVDNGTINVSGITDIGCSRNNASSSTGILSLGAGAVWNSESDFRMGFAGAAASQATLNLNGGTLNVASTVTRWMVVGQYDATNAAVNVTSGNLKLNAGTSIKFNTQNSTGTHTITQSGGAVTFFSDNGITPGGAGAIDLRQNVSTGVNTYHLDGGTLTVPQIISTRQTGTREFNFNGGTLRPAASRTDFFNNGAASAANVKAGGALIDTNGFNITLGQSLLAGSPSGGLTKSGVGTLTMGGTSTYTGATIVSAGTLALGGAGSINSSSGITVNGSGARLLQTGGTASTPAITLTQGTVAGTGQLGPVTVGAGSGGIVSNGNGTSELLLMDSLTFAGAGTLNLNIAGGSDYYNFGIYLLGSLTTSGGPSSVTVNVAPTNPLELGQSYDLVSAPTFTGDVNCFVYGGNTARVTGVFSYNSGILGMTLNGDAPKWTGLDNGNWQLGSTGASKNWKLQSAGTATDYIASDLVLFDDSAAGSTSISISLASVSPGSTTFDNSSKDYSVSSPGGFGIAGSGPLVKNGTGKLTLNTDNTYSGATTINAGTLQIGSGGTTGSLSPASAITNHGTLTFNRADTVTLANGITGTGSVTQLGSGTLVLGAANSYTGTTSINAGTVTFSANNGLGETVAPVALNGGTLRPTVGGGAIVNTHPVTIGAGGGIIHVSNTSVAGTPTFAMGATGNLTGGGNLTVIGDGPLVFGAGADVLVLNNANESYTGTVEIKDGAILEYANNNGVGAAASFVVGNNGVLSASNATIANNVTVNSGGFLAFQNTNTGLFSGAVTLNANATIRLQDWWSANVRNGTISGGISGSGGLAVTSGSGTGGTLTLSGTNTYAGNTSVTASTLKVASPASLPGHATPGKVSIDGTSTLAVNAGGSGEFTTPDLDTLPTNVTFAPGAILGIDTTNAGASLSYGSSVSGALGLAKYGTGTLVLTGSNGYSGATKALGGTLEFQGAGSLSTASALTLGNGATLSLRADADTAFAATSLAALSGASTYHFLVNSLNSPAGDGHTLSLPGPAAAAVAGNPTINVSSSTGDTLGFASTFQISTNSGAAWGGVETGFNLTDADVILNGLSNSGSNLNGGIAVNSATDSRLTINGNVNTNASRTLYAKVNSGTLVLNNSFSGGGGANWGFFAHLNGGKLDLNSPTAINGNSAGNHWTLLLNSGTLDNSSGAAVTMTTNPTVGLNGDIGFSTPTSTSANNLNLGNGAVAMSGSRTITTHGNATLTFGGSIGDGGAAYALTKSGTGTLSLGGANTFTGGAVITAGRLDITGDSGGATGLIDVQSGATLGGSGNLGGNVTIQSGGHQAIQVAADSGSQVTRTITGVLDISSNDIVDLMAAAPPAAGNYVLLTATGGITGTLNTIHYNGISGTLSINGNTLELTVTGSSGYASWASSKGLDGSNNGENQDPNNNGILNLMEYVLNGDPKNAEAPSAVLPTLNTSGANLVFTYSRLDASLADTVQTFQYGSDLSGAWTNIIVPTASGSVGAATVTVTDGTPTDTVQISVPKSGAKMFGRLKVAK
ncbi:MAG: autotransporter-associated beta strand repeat-containing protein [Verrucomicrobiota bacterium]